MGVLALTNNMIAFTFSKVKSPCLSHFSKNACRNLLQRHWIRLEKCCVMVVIRWKNVANKIYSLGKV